MNSIHHNIPVLPAEAINDLRIKPVDNSRSLDQFIRLPWSIYRDDPVWVPPLLMERRQHLSCKNPFFEHARYRSWIAHRNGNPVGRISAQIDQIHLQRYHDATGFFGMLEAENDPRIFKALITTAETWLRHQGMKRVFGPFNLSINQECGLLIEGFDTSPVIMTGHAPPYYRHRLEQLGYVKEKDLLAYSANIDFKLSPAMKAIIRRNKPRVHVRQLIRRQKERDLQIIQDIFEDAWSENWGFIPFTPAEFRHLGRDLLMLVPPDFVQIAEIEGKPAAMIVGFPNVNEAIDDLNGRLFPFGWLKLLWRLKVGFPKTARVPLMGIRKSFQKSRLGAALALMIIDKLRTQGLRRGIRQAEFSWILEDNLGMRTILDSIGAKAHKRYRIFGKSLVQKTSIDKV